MSAATEKNSPVTRFRTSELEEPELIEVPVQGHTVKISFTLTDGVWTAASDHETLPITQGELAQIKWVLELPENADPELPLHFNDPPLLFPIQQPAAPMVAINDPATSPRECVVIWSNRDFARRGAYRYFINVTIGTQVVIHDPTVENDPPN
jgi:hypothetical protein